MKTKKILSFALAAIMTFSMGVTSLGANITTDGGAGQTLVTYGSSESFIITIPEAVNQWEKFQIDEETELLGAMFDVSASDVMIGENRVLRLMLDAGNFNADEGTCQLVDVSDPDNKLNYFLIGDSLEDMFAFNENNMSVLNVFPGEINKSRGFSAIMMDEITIAGQYQSIYTFTANIENTSNITKTIKFRIDNSMVESVAYGTKWKDLTGGYYGPNLTFVDGYCYMNGNQIAHPNGTPVKNTDYIYDNVEYIYM